MGQGLKRIVRNGSVQSALAWLVSIYLRTTLATMRWRFENREGADAVVAGQSGAVACFWHGGIGLAPACRRLLKQKPRRVLISVSPDGEFVAKTVKHLGLPAIRGSSTMDNRAYRRSIDALRDAAHFVSGGGVLLITPDGPRGPAQHMAPGPVVLARLCDAPVFLVGFAAQPTLSLSSWDRTRIPLPFGRGCIVIDGPMLFPKEAGPQALEAVRLEWEDRLRAVQTRAEAGLAAQTRSEELAPAQ
jgi:lysophospholipid acyltransferase (LPLAT)-like uncharacterized protein